MDTHRSYVTLLTLFVGIGLALCFLLWNVEIRNFASVETYKTIITKPGQKPLCTYRMLRSYYKKNKYWPSTGHWDRVNGEDRFTLDMCEFQHSIYPSELLKKCVIESNISSIVTFGDSTGSRYHNSLQNFLSRTRKGGACKGVSHEAILSKGFFPDKEYYAPGNEEWAKYVNVQRRKCRTCLGKRHQCHVSSDGQSRDIKTEHISWLYTIDATITIPDNVTNSSSWSAPTSQEFYFKYFLKGRYPDVMVLFMPFHHSPDFDLKLDVHIQQLKMLQILVNKYIPRTTRVFYIPTDNEVDKRYRKPYPRRNGLRRNDLIDLLNKALYGILEADFLDARSGRYGFIDLFSISKERSNWSADGIHMEPKWYNLVMSMFWELFCNSVRNKEM